MDSHILLSQVNEMRNQLVRAMISQTINDPETKMFSKPIVLAYLDNSDMVCNIYGFRQGIILFDSMNSSLEVLDPYSIPIDHLIRVKDELENFEKSKQYSNVFQR